MNCTLETFDQICNFCLMAVTKNESHFLVFQSHLLGQKHLQKCQQQTKVTGFGGEEVRCVGGSLYPFSLCWFSKQSIFLSNEFISAVVHRVVWQRFYTVWPWDATQNGIWPLGGIHPSDMWEPYHQKATCFFPKTFPKCFINSLYQYKVCVSTVEH